MDESKMQFLQNVLRYSTSHSDGTSSTSAAAGAAREMSPERRKWLENALDNMSINPIEEIKKCINCLADANQVDKHVSALDTLRDWCEDMNFAIDFHKINKYEIIFSLLNNENAEIRALTCDLVGTLAQNNEYCQETLLASKVMPLLFQKLDKDADEVKVKALYAISAMCRHYEPAQEKLVESANGVDILIRALSSSNEKLVLKACFLFSSICENVKVKRALTEKHLVETLIDLYRRTDTNVHEHVLAAINVLVDENPDAVKQALNMNMNGVDFKSILTNRLQSIQDDPSHDEERDMAKRILEKFFKN